MKNKTCGECKFYVSEAKRCNLRKIICNIQASDRNCSCFEQKPIPKPTNGDRIRQGGDYALAHFKSEHRCDVCAYYALIDTAPACRRPEGKICFDGMLAWLNAPADCVSQNGKNDTQADLCITDDTQDQEVKHE